MLGMERVGIRDNFFALGGHSLLAVRLMALLRERTGRALPLSALFQGATVEQLADRMEPSSEAAPRTPNIARLDTGDSQRRPLFLVHGGGGGVLSYADLVRHLGNDRPIHGFFAPGLEGGELPPGSMESLARIYVDQMRDVQPHGPYRLAGWSLGGLVAYEMARQLQAQGELVELLALIDSIAPSGQPEPEPPPLVRLAGFARMVGLPLKDAPAEALEELNGTHGPELLTRMLDVVRQLPAAGGLEPAQIERLFAVHERLSEAHRGYVPPSLYGGSADFFQAASHASAPTRDAHKPWTEWITGDVAVSEVPGDHLTLLQAPNVATLAEKLSERLRELEAREQ
ncbi:non-ribosomal peptide synthetase [Corallococcus llansteffanensis]|uniref:Non-ribosomal peptide synthetase n=1 Tax=Corallococcus llansteffanensis TaxID=2316731 RepID=A0A3A8NFI3_9BACT|nr:non-ribosomal peptide synthetase [Corallococcus llansteffanensis]